MEPITKTRKNRISKKARTECFLAALGPFLVEAKKYQHYKKAVDGNQER